MVPNFKTITETFEIRGIVLIFGKLVSVYKTVGKQTKLFPITVTGFNLRRLITWGGVVASLGWCGGDAAEGAAWRSTWGSAKGSSISMEWLLPWSATKVKWALTKICFLQEKARERDKESTNRERELFPGGSKYRIQYPISLSLLMSVRQELSH